MWAVTAGGVRELFGEDAWIIDAIYTPKIHYEGRYQVEVLTFRTDAPNKYRLVQLDVGDYEKVWVGEFDTPQELVAIAKLILASGTN